MVIHMNITSFENAFDTHCGSSRATCACGRRFYNNDGGWDWEEGELEKLEADSTATNLEWSIGYVEFEGVTFVVDCECWKKRAQKIMEFLDGHRREICEYFKLEKQRALKEANDLPDV